VIAAHCGLAGALDAAHEAFLASLDAVSVAAVMGRRRAPVA